MARSRIAHGADLHLPDDEPVVESGPPSTPDPQALPRLRKPRADLNLVAARRSGPRDGQGAPLQEDLSPVPAIRTVETMEDGVVIHDTSPHANEVDHDGRETRRRGARLPGESQNEDATSRHGGRGQFDAQETEVTAEVSNRRRGRPKAPQQRPPLLGLPGGSEHFKRANQPFDRHAPRGAGGYLRQRRPVVARGKGVKAEPLKGTGAPLRGFGRQPERPEAFGEQGIGLGLAGGQAAGLVGLPDGLTPVSPERGGSGLAERGGGRGGG